MAINEETVKQVAKLAKLEIEEESIHAFTKEIDQIVDMVEQLEELDTEGVEGTYHGLPQKNVWREDKVQKGTDREELFKNVKTRKDGYIEVPAMFDNGGSEA
ncbi:Asp-tRNA(Asn)/Glu-tRNA(Gln) amidotransferase subunit GatC [Alkalibacterium putridalgicola]|jgi:aspartyl-tRNA(Asn)/glutamyl-tRNA(Gln) amidotransferase subunit C|uniref:Aspartyl/glutamyl-tRNA(Asn/Gln) amidotransferase subunit C n=1 Tax=Alkalibacterium putridalgicola TaxID=426703 RepID=A0A1H7UIG3_9LACT|nr:Asp-tRNA(Asn)/Glu-tRNA(Gln) amidotransferase subunit GatC [Alkalibacterium putridalgicola]GEK88286.1 aspartyl/glutamyl-tRNA(Asn/Gln) amidotransferase subunit C [Alkalibacterium putridalgicola]SEL96534.1 aspartyl/glutamyl-tRNA(Asn/Gln) amidotransferase subunit C [Alkalibacterium putridalgicola]